MNLYAYCGNNPVSGYDPYGAYDWREAVKNAVMLHFAIQKKALEQTVNAIAEIVGTVLSCAEIKLNVGLGIGFDLSNNVTAELSRSVYVGFDDGEAITGNEATMELSLFDKIGIGNTYDRLSEKGGRMVSPATNPNEGMFGMIEDPNTTIDQSFTIACFKFDDDGDFLISGSVGGYLGAGGEISVGYNFTELLKRLFWE